MIKILERIVLLAVLIVSGLTLFSIHTSEQLASVSSPVGTTNTTAKFFSVAMVPSTGSATSSSILNNSTTDRAIVSTNIMCQGVGTSKTAYSGAGLANWLWKAGTTSTAISGNLADVNTNYAAAITQSTTTVDSYTGSTTEGVLTGTSRIWPANSYLTFQPNATNTAACTIGVYAIQL